MLPMMTPPAGWTLAGARRWKNPVSRRCCCSNGRYCCSGAFLPSLPLSLSLALRVSWKPPTPLRQPSRFRARRAQGHGVASGGARAVELLAQASAGRGDGVRRG